LLTCQNFIMIYSLAALTTLFQSVSGACPYSHDAPQLFDVSGDKAAPPGWLDGLDGLDWDALRTDIETTLTTDRDFWPSDYGHYGPFMVRLAWHCAGSYRRSDGRGGCDGARIRFVPELSWEDNTNLDKARRILEPLKEKYGVGLSWGDLIQYAAYVAMEQMGLTLPGFCAGRVDNADGLGSAQLGTNEPFPNFGVFEQTTLFPCAEDGDCMSPLGAVKVGLIYVNPAGVFGEPDPNERMANQIRDTFLRMGMNDTETVALIGGGHAFGKAHGACPSGPGPSPAQDPSNPWPGTCPGEGADGAFTSGFEGPWTINPTTWDNDYFIKLAESGDDFLLMTGPGGNPQWSVANPEQDVIRNEDIMMLTSDITLSRGDPIYRDLVMQFGDRETGLAFLSEQFGEAWYKLSTRDMGPHSRCVGPNVPSPRPFQFPLPPAPTEFPNWSKVRTSIKHAMTDNGASFSELAFKCASTYRHTDHQGGCNGARIMHEPYLSWDQMAGMREIIDTLTPVYEEFPDLTMADLIMFAGQVAVEEASGMTLEFCPGRSDLTEFDEGWMDLDLLEYNETTSVQIIQVFKERYIVAGVSAEHAVALRARLRSESVMQDLGFSGNWGEQTTISNEYFRVLLNNVWYENPSVPGEYVSDTMPGAFMTQDDMVLSWDAALRAIAQAYLEDNEYFLTVFGEAWIKLSNNDRHDGPENMLCMASATSTSNNTDPVTIIASVLAGLVIGGCVGSWCMRRQHSRRSSSSLNDPLLHQ
jgi:catalase (peroxidase I)